MARSLLQTLHDHAENEAMFVFANDLLKVEKDFSPFDVHVVLSGEGLSKDDFRIKHVPSGLEYQVRFTAKGTAPFTLSVSFEVTRLETGCESVLLGEDKNALESIYRILCDAIVGAHLRRVVTSEKGKK